MSFLLAGLATGLGKGISDQATFNAKQAEAQRDRDFQVALENLRKENNMAVDANQGEINRQNTREEYGLRETERKNDHGRSKEIIGLETGSKIQVDNNQASNQLKIEKVRGDIDRQNDEYSLRLKNQLESGEVKDVLLGADGEYIGVTKTGAQIRTGVMAHPIDTTPRSSGSGSSSLLEGLDMGPTPAATPRPAATSAPARAPAAPPKTYTQAEAAATAKQYGVTVQQVHDQMKRAGYKLVN